MAYTRVKICGITRPEDAALAAELGADAIGLNFLAGPRKIEFSTGRKIAATVRAASSAITLVGLTGNVQQVSRDFFRPVPLPLSEVSFVDALQIYGTGPYGREASGFKIWVVAHVIDEFLGAMIQLLVKYAGATVDAVLVDGAKGNQLGGTGVAVNWNEVAEAWSYVVERGLKANFILAGGLTPENVAEAIRIARPYAVDVSSGVEVAGKPGVKDPIKMRDFIQAAKSAL